MFHAFIECGSDFVDFTTYSFHEKARQLDAADGGKTDVRWAPEFLWVDRESCSSLDAVANGFSEGVFCYMRKPAVEAIVLAENPDFDAAGMADTVFSVLNLMKSGHQVRVLGVGDGEVQELDGAVSSSLSVGLKAAEGSLLFGLPTGDGKSN